MNRRTILTLSAIATFGLAALSLGQSALAADPTIAGTWELNVAASKSTEPMPKSITRTYEVVGKSEKLTGTIVTADGKTIPISFTATLDGKDSPLSIPGRRYAGSDARRCIDDEFHNQARGQSRGDRQPRPFQGRKNHDAVDQGREPGREAHGVHYGS